MFKGYKYRLYPNKEQEKYFAKCFGCVRFIYNRMLSDEIEHYNQTGQKLNILQSNYKKEFPWLKEIDSLALANAQMNLQKAYDNFFNKPEVGFPKFKSKKNSKKSYTTSFVNTSAGGNIRINFENGKVLLPRVKWVKAKLHRKFNGKIKSATISQSSSGKYYISILVETEHTPIDSTGCVIGVDLGIKDLLITSDGEKFDNIRTTKKYKEKLAKEQRSLAHKVKGSKNYDKQKIKVARIYEKMHNVRIDYLHKISYKLISENQVIVSEDLAISNMTKNHNLAEAILDCGWYELTRHLHYKADWNNRQYIKVGRFTKSSQSCNACGYINTKTKNLAVREWICPNCGTVHDRDINAAINILNEGLRMLSAS